MKTFRYRFPAIILWATLIVISFPGCCPDQLPQKPPSFSGDLTDRGDRNTILFVGDVQRTGWMELFREQNDDVRPAIWSALASADPAAMIIMGDLVFWASSQSDWELFDGYARQIREKQIPVFALRGNHEYFGCDKQGYENFYDRFPHLNRRSWNTVRFKSIAIVLLNSNIDDMGEAEAEQQQQWYWSEMDMLQADAAIQSIIVSTHHSPFTNSTLVHPSKDVQQRFLGRFDSSSKASLFISGHCHAYERFQRNGKHYIVSGGGGGPRQELKSPSDEGYFHDLSPVQGEIRPFHYCLVTLGRDSINVSMHMLHEQNGIWSIGDEIGIPLR